MSNRILRSGSSFDTDYLLNEIIEEWKNLEDNLNIEIDSKVASFSKEIKIQLIQISLIWVSTLLQAT